MTKNATTVVLSMFALIVMSFTNLSKAMDLILSYLGHLPTLSRVELFLFIATWITIGGIVVRFKTQLTEIRMKLKSISEKIESNSAKALKYTDLMERHMEKISLMADAHAESFKYLKEEVTSINKHLRGQST
jgi:hypothetical protein